MKLASFTFEGRTRVGLVEDTEIIDLALSVPALPADMTAFLAMGPAAIEAVENRASEDEARFRIDDVTLEAPVPRPGKFFGVGLNYADHIQETGREAPEFPVFFNKQTTCVNGPYQPIHRPRASTHLDYEGELAFVIGRRCRHVSRANGPKVIAGYTIVNDVSVRDWQWRAPTMTLGKSWDTHGPMGPWLVTPDEIGDPHALGLRTFVNDELRQESNTRELIFDCYHLVEILSTVFTLEPGDVIATGTPSGVAFAMNNPKWLAPGDRVRVEVEKIGHIENTVIDEPSDAERMD